MNVTGSAAAAFRRKIFRWWKTNKRDLPWRKTRDPYRILISEVMLQQTQVSRVLPKYEEFLREFPDVSALAGATPARVLMLWRGMGYNRRALYLKQTAEAVVRAGGSFPDSEQELRKLPGLGIYTARAIMVFAFGKDVAMVDTNIRQIITHFFFSGLPQKEKVIQETADFLVPAGKSWEWHQALMDYGALELAKLRTKSPRTKKPATPFKESDRYFRGRIVDALREGTADVSQLTGSLSSHYGKSAEFFTRILGGLEKDGLVVRSGRRVGLPGSA